ncbi:MAG: NAD-dependent epimerase/dehydratase family protein [Elusimicrobia bacterium]|nr:NAD-dependent epimerase/dehydratase family protein [Elusimicrobiota bacterium]
MRTALVTGGTGFIAGHVMPALAARGWRVRASVRSGEDLGRLPPGVDGFVTGPLDARTDWSAAAAGAQLVIHLAGSVHEPAGEAACRTANVEGTRALALAARRAGVGRFVFASSVKAMGEGSAPGEVWDETRPCRPQDAYGRSKLSAEHELADVAKDGGLEAVILRLPMVHGPGVKANMRRLLRAVQKGLPMPLGLIRNARSLLFVGNAVDAMLAAAEHPAAKGETFLLCDGEAVSTPELVRCLARAMGKRAILLPIPIGLLRGIGALAGRACDVDRLASSLAVDCGKFKRLAAWTPPFSVHDGLRQTAEWFANHEKSV